MRRALDHGYELDDDRDRIDAGVVHRYLREESYWAQSRTREQSDLAIANSSRVVGLYHEQQMVGFARVVSDDVQFAYLADVFVEATHRGDGRGVELVREAVDNGPQADLMWFLGTRDAHTLYEKFGFTKPDDRWMTRRRA